MSEQQMVESVQQALGQLQVEESVLAAGQFLPRGHTGSMFAGGMIGSGVGGSGLADSIATVGGSIAGYRLHDAASGLPASMLVGVTATSVYGFAAATRRSEPGALVFAVRRDGISAKVHPRVNVRVLELIDDSTGARIELEGNRLPVTHAKDVIQELT